MKQGSASIIEYDGDTMSCFESMTIFIDCILDFDFCNLHR